MARGVIRLCVCLALCLLHGAVAQQEPAAATDPVDHPPVDMEAHPPADDSQEPPHEESLATDESQDPPVQHSVPPAQESVPETGVEPDAGCQVSEWTPWSECTKSCGGGSSSRSREVLHTASGECDQELEQSQSCNTQSCALRMIDIEGVEAWPMQRPSIVNVIDGDVESWTYTTKGWCKHDSIYVGLKFPKGSLVSGVRVFKKYQHSSNHKKDCNRKNIQLYYSTDSHEVPLERHGWQPVHQARNGHADGAELWDADAVRPNGFIAGEQHNSADRGWASVSFAPTEMSGLALEVANGSGGEFNHFCLGEIQAFYAPRGGSEL